MIFVLEKAYFIANMSGLAWSCRPVLTLESTLSMKLVQREESFQIMPGSYKETDEKGKKDLNSADINIAIFIFAILTCTSFYLFLIPHS